MSIISASTTTTTAYKVTADTTGTLVLQTGSTPTTAVTIDTAQKVGIGITSPTGTLHVANASASVGQLRLQYTGSNFFEFQAYSDNKMYINNSSGSSQMVFDGSGNVGIGTSSPSARLSTSSTSGTGNGISITDTTYSDTHRIYGDNSLQISAGTGGVGAILFRTASTERARITSGGDLLVGTTTASSKLTVNSEMSLAADNNNRGILTWSSGGLVFGTINASTTYFNSMTLKDGNLLIGATGSVMSGGGKIEIRGDFYNGNTGIALSTSNDTTGALYAQFGNSAGTRIGSITRSGTSTVAYNTSSDYRLKENVQPMVGVLAKIQALRPVTYQWKEDGSDGEGFIAHELAEVCPQAVAGEKDAVDADGNPVYQGIDTSFLVATLTAAIQEQQAIIETLTNRITALEAK